MDEFVIEGGVPLKGEVTPAGNKNAALPIMAACLLIEEPVILHNIPQIRDIQAMRRLIESLGAEVEELDQQTWRINAALRAIKWIGTITKIRASVHRSRSSETTRRACPPACSRRRCDRPPQLDTHILA
jgi:UDP-N-acetylglucosamine enolpyruvyl transferase